MEIDWLLLVCRFYGLGVFLLIVYFINGSESEIGEIYKINTISKDLQKRKFKKIWAIIIGYPLALFPFIVSLYIWLIYVPFLVIGEFFLLLFDGPELKRKLKNIFIEEK